MKHLARNAQSMVEKQFRRWEGRGGQFIIRPEHALRVRVICPEEQRNSGFAERQGLSRDKAHKRVSQTERDRHGFYRKHFHEMVTEPTHYDLLMQAHAAVGAPRRVRRAQPATCAHTATWLLRRDVA